MENVSDIAPVPAVRTVAERRGFSPRGVLAIASLGASVAFVDATIVNIAFPDIAKSFPGTPISSLSWILSAYNIVFAAFLVAAGRFADLVGRRRMFIAGLSTFTLASLACAVAPSVGVLIAFRLIQAVGAAIVVPASLALVLHAFPEDRRSHGTALLAAVAAGAAGLGPSLGGVLISIANWRLVFLVNIPIGLAAILLGRAKLIESRAPGRRRLPDLVGAAVFAGAVASLVLAIVKGQEWGWGSARILAAFAVGLALAVWFVQRCRTQRSPMIDLSLLRIRTFSAANSMTLIAAAGYYGYTLANVLFLTGVWKYSVLDAGLALTPGPFVAAAVAGPSSRLALRIGHRPVLVAGGLIWGGAILWFVARVGLEPNFLRDWLPGIVLLGVGAGILLPNISGAAVASAPGEGYAVATALNSVARQVGAALGVAVIVAILTGVTATDALSTFDTAWKFAAGCMFVAAAGCLLVGRVRGDAAPNLASAARTALAPAALTPAVARPAPRARRAVAIGAARSEPRRETAADFLGAAPLFAGLDEALRSDIASMLRSVHVTAGDYLFREGDAGDSMYLVRTGRLAVIDEREGKLIRELGRGDALGELALISGTPRSASLRASRNSELYELDSANFHALLRENPELSLALNRVLAERLRESRAATEARRPRPATVALVHADGEGEAALARELAGALAGQVRCALLDETLAGESGPDGYAPLIDRAEADNELVLLDAGTLAAPTPWTDLALRQADRILCVVHGGEPDERVGSRADLRGCDLVIRRGSGGGYSPAWGDALDPAESHVVRDDCFDDDVARIARRLSGNSLGIVFSGGGARAFSHIGVIEELEAAGLVADRVAGVSMGAFIGALYASEKTGEEIDEICFAEWVQRQPLRDFTLPRHGLIRGQRVEAMLRRVFGGRTVEELPRSFLCASAELRSGRLEVSRHGPLPESVGYSMNVPILAPPRVHDREMFVDGSLVDNLPVKLLADQGEGPIIAVDVKATFGDGGAPRPNKTRPSRAPLIGETITRVLLLASSDTSQAAQRYADIVIKPRAEGVGLLEFHQLDAAREAGRAAAREALEADAG